VRRGPVQKVSFPLPAEYERLRPIFDVLFREVLRDLDVRNADGQPGLIWSDGQEVRKITLGPGLAIVDGQLIVT
jgi:hypothetical protein